MPNRLRHTRAGIAHQVLSASTSTGAGTEFDLQTPLSDWSLQVVAASTDTIVTLDLSLQSSSGAAFESKLTWSNAAGQASGDIVSLSSTPGRQVRATLEAGASSAGASAWIAGV